VNRGYNAFVAKMTSRNMMNHYRRLVGNRLTTH
jgi:hypothetical protein